MKKLLHLLFLLVIVLVSSLILPEHFVYSQESPVEQTVNFRQHFERLGVNGSIIIYDLDRDSLYQHNPTRNDTSFLPASTYKIPNSLIALETRIIQDDVSVLTWDGIERGFNDSPIEVWNQDLNLRLAFKYSAVWFYQVLARRIGYDMMQEFVSKIEYGNQNIGKSADIDRFWLEGELSITPK